MEGKGLYNFMVRKMLEGRPKVIKDLLRDEGKQMINKIFVCRKPIQKTFEKIINALTFGKFKKKMKQYNYDSMFHLQLFVKLENGKTYMIEKNQRVNVKRVSSNEQYGHATKKCLPLDISHRRIILNTLITNAEAVPNLYRYNAFKDNCQKFVYDLLNRSGISQFNDFIMQQVNEFAPGVFKKVLRGITDVAGFVDYAKRGGRYQ